MFKNLYYKLRYGEITEPIYLPKESLWLCQPYGPNDKKYKKINALEYAYFYCSSTVDYNYTYSTANSYTCGQTDKFTDLLELLILNPMTFKFYVDELSPQEALLMFAVQAKLISGNCSKMSKELQKKIESLQK